MRYPVGMYLLLVLVAGLSNVLWVALAIIVGLALAFPVAWQVARAIQTEQADSD